MRKGYGQFCPVAKAAEVFAERWTPLVIRELLAGSTHFNDLHRGVPLMSRTLLSLRLRQLEEVGVVKQTSGPGGQEYILTDAGREFGPIVEKLGTWGQHWFRTTFSKDELDVTLLMWDMRRTVRPEAFPPGQNTVQLELAGVPAGKRNWWLVCNAQEVDLCATDPGFEVDLFVTTDLKTATRIWMGDLAVKAAMSMGSLKLNGSRDLQRHFEAWLGRSSFAGVEDARRAAR